MYDDDQDALAAEYVLGTLAAEERDQAEALLSIDPGFAAIVRQWERRLGELNVMVEAVEPPPELWDKIKTEIGDVEQGTVERANVDQDNEVPLLPLDLGVGAPPSAMAMEDEESSPVAALASTLLPPEEALEFKSSGEKPSARSSLRPEPKIERSADVVYLSGRVKRWRNLTVGLGALAALLAAFIAISAFAPGLLPFGHPSSQLAARPPGPARPQGSRLVAVLQQEPTAPAFLLTVDSLTRTLTVRRVSATPEAGRSYELWLISKRLPKPRSLGLVGNDEFTQRPLPANFEVDTLREASYAVSLEPAGGSKSGEPTGPILFTGRLVDALPGSPPPS